MTLELLVAAMHKGPLEIAEEMQIGSDAVIVSQGDHYAFEELEYQGNRIRYFAMKERGVGLSRNTSLMRAQADIGVFADEDIVYVPGYRELILSEFEKHPDADMIMFNVQAMPGRETYHIDKPGRVRIYNCGGYATYSCAVRMEAVRQRNITFSLLFGGGARYSNGEDSLFILECIKKGMKVYKVPILIGSEIERESTWFSGYHEKFFFDRGVLYHHLYGILAIPCAVYFLMAHKDEMCREMGSREAFRTMCRGIREGAVLRGRRK